MDEDCPSQAISPAPARFIFIGWNEQFEGLVNAIRRREPTAELHLISFHKPRGRNEESPGLQWVPRSKKSDLDEDVLREAGFYDRETRPTVIVLSDERTAKHRQMKADMHTLRIIRRFREIEWRTSGPGSPTRLLAEVESTRNRPLAHHLGASRSWGPDPAFGSDTFQVISPRKTANNLLAQIILKPGLEPVTRQLLREPAESPNPVQAGVGNRVGIHQVKVGDLPWRNAFSCYNDLRGLLARDTGDYPVTLLGVRYSQGSEVVRDSTRWARRVRPLHTSPSAAEGARVLFRNDSILFLATDVADLGRALEVAQLED